MRSLLVVGALITFGGCTARPAPHSPMDRPITARLIRTTDLGKLTPPSPDSSGIAYLPDRDEFVVVDSEVEEGQFFRGVNMWFLTRRGVVKATGSTLRYTREPSGVAYNPKNGHLLVSDDDNDRVFDVRAGRDSRLGTADDRFEQTDVNIFGDSDTEDVALDTATGEDLLVDARRGRVNKLVPATNGRASHHSSFDISRYGATDVEGITYDAARNTILLVSHRTHYVYEVTPTGALVSLIDISEAFDKKASGLVLAPASSGSGATSLYVVDRGVDNNPNPTVSDGMLYELGVNLPPAPSETRSGR
jgi:hypothetical protein